MSGALLNSTRNPPTVTQSEDQDQSYWNMSLETLVPWAVAYTIVAVAILVGNSLVIVSFGKKKVLRTHTNYFIVSLAATDCFVGVVSIPWWIALMFVSHNGETWFKFLHDIWIIMDILGGVGSILHLVALSWDRLCAIVWPLNHRIYSSRRYVLILVSIWSFALPVAVCSKPGMASAPLEYNVSVITLCFFLPLIIVCVTQAAIVISIRKSNIRNAYRFKRTFRKEVRVAKTVLIMIGIFLMGWLPFFTLSLVTFIKTDVVVSWHAICAVKFLQYSNSVANPLLYAHKFPHFRKAFTAILCPCRSVGRKARIVGESFRNTMTSFTFNPASTGRKNGNSYSAHHRNAVVHLSSNAVESSVDDSALDAGPEEIRLQLSNSASQETT